MATYIRTAEHKRLMSEKLKGKPKPLEARRNMSKAQILRKQKYGYLQSPEYRKKRSEIMKGNSLAKRYDFNEESIINIYQKENLPAMQIAKIFNTTHNTILTILRKNNIKIREQKFYITGEKNWNWMDGKSFEPYSCEFNKAFKEAIRIRDGFLCLRCGMLEEDSKILFKRTLTCHHIDYDKQNTIPENCCALCYRCNLQVNSNRKSWTKFFQSMLAERYGYKYSEDGKVIIELKSEEIKDV